MSRIPYFDEINAWNIAANCNFIELLEVCKHEGHFLLWYYLIKPFAANNIGFPMAMFAINWLFAFASVLILWFKAPFKPWLKILITFSFPFQMYSIYARCYAIGLFCLFIICSLYKERKKHTIIYPLMILILANTSVIGTMAGFCLGVLYVYELLKDRIDKKIDTKTLLTPVYIFILCAVFILLQLANFKVPTYSIDKRYIHFIFFDFFKFVKYLPTDIVIVIQSFLLLTGIKFFIKDIKPYLFLIFSTAIILCIGYNIYALACWHYCFLYLFLVAAMWIYMEEHEITTKFQKLYYILFFILSFWVIFFFKAPWIWNGFHIPTVHFIEKNYAKFNNSNIFLYPTDSSVVGIVPTFHDYNIRFYDPLGNSFKSANTYIEQWGPRKLKVDFHGIRKVLLSDPKTQLNYIFVTTAEFKKQYDKVLFFKELEHNDTDLKIEPYLELKDVSIYTISINKHKK